MRMTQELCNRAVGRLAKMVDQDVYIEYYGQPNRPRLALATGDEFVRWLSPQLPLGAFYNWIDAMTFGIKLYWEKEATCQE